AKKERERAERLLERMHSDINQLKRLRHGDNNGTTSLEALLPNRYKEVVFSDIAGSKPNNVILENTINYLRGMLRTHRPAMERVTQHLIRDPQLNPSTVHDILTVTES